MKRPRITRRRFLQTLGLASLTTTATYAYARAAASHLTVENLTIPIPDLAPSRIGTRLVHLSDLHAGRTDISLIARALHIAADLNPHYLLITGDFIDNPSADIDQLANTLRPITSKIPTYGCPGNHDFRRRAPVSRLYSQLRSAGVNLLVNTFHQPTPGPGQLCFVGLDDLWHGNPDPSALARAPQDAATLLLSHNPDSYELVAPHRFHLMLSGHTHGGQVCLPGIGPILLPVQHRERAAGLFHLDPANPTRALYVTRGVGHLTKVRLFCPPEITHLTLT